MSTYNPAAIQAQMEQYEKEQAERASYGIEGIYYNFYVPEGQAKTIRFLTPFDFGLIYFVHVDWRLNSQGKKVSTSYLCESNFSQDPMAYCPICQARKDHEHMGKSNPAPWVQALRNFLIYDYSAEGQTYQYQGQTFPEPVIGLYKVREGGWNKETWERLKYLDTSYGGLNNIDVGIIKTDIEMFVDPYNGSSEIFTQNPSTFDANRIPANIREIIPPIQQKLDLRNPQDGELLGTWAKFLEQAGAYKRADKYSLPDVNRTQMPHTGAPSYNSPAPPNAQGSYGNVPFHTPQSFAPGIPQQAAPQLPPPPAQAAAPVAQAPVTAPPVNNAPPALPPATVAPPPPAQLTPPVATPPQAQPPVAAPPPMETNAPAAYTAPQNPPPPQPSVPETTNSVPPTAAVLPQAPDAPLAPVAELSVPEAKKPWN